MQERDVLDLLLVIALAALTYVETFGLGNPLAHVEEIVSLLAGVDVGVYVVLAGILGIVFLGYLTIYLPNRDAGRPVRKG